MSVESPITDKMSSAVVEEARRIAKQFDYPTGEVNRAVEEFRRQMDEGLAKQGATLSQIPTYVTAVPNGSEKGVYLAVDLGGTNFRVCSVQLHGDSTFALIQTKTPIPLDLMSRASSSEELFSFLAKQIQSFLEEHHSEHYGAHVRKRQIEGSKEKFKEEEIFDLGFTFSFPVNQVGINRGTLIRWTKGFDIAEVVGQDVCALLQEALDGLHLPVRVAALVNDTVGTLMARSYTSPGTTGTLIGAIFGTGTNGAYVEKLSRIAKMDSLSGVTYDKSTGEMVINTEWGSFDNHLSVLPNTQYDRDLDAESVNPGIQMFEKRVSGMFLGEILRRAILHMVEDPSVNLFHSGDGGDPTIVPTDSVLYDKWGIDTSFLSIVEADTSHEMHTIKELLKKELLIDGASTEDCLAMKVLVTAIGKRAARLSAVPLAAVMISTGKLETEDVVDIGVDGSLIEYYPTFESSIREALREIPQVGKDGEPKVRIGIAKDGSGVGAALIALVARQAEK